MREQWSCGRTGYVERAQPVYRQRRSSRESVELVAILHSRFGQRHRRLERSTVSPTAS